MLVFFELVSQAVLQLKFGLNLSQYPFDEATSGHIIGCLSRIFICRVTSV